MENFLKVLQNIVGTQTTNLLISFTGNNEVTIITTIKRLGNKPDLPLKISGSRDEVAEKYFNILSETKNKIDEVSLKTNATEIVAAVEEENKEETKRAEVKANAKKPTKVEKPAKVEDPNAKLFKDPNWIAAFKAFREKHYGQAKTYAEKILNKYQYNKELLGLIGESKIGLGIWTREEAQKNGHVKWEAPEAPSATNAVSLPPNKNFDDEKAVVNPEPANPNDAGHPTPPEPEPEPKKEEPFKGFDDAGNFHAGDEDLTTADELTEQEIQESGANEEDLDDDNF